MIIVCPECQAQYSVADAKVRGRKVRVTCKHCKNGIIVDGFALDVPPPPPSPRPVAPSAPAAPFAPATPAPAPFESVPAIFDALRVAPEDDATRVMRKPQDFSVHDEPTVVGRIPQEALEAERRFAQSTIPPPKDGEAEPPAPAPAPPPVSVAPLSDPPGPPSSEPAPQSPAPLPPHAVPLGSPEQPLDFTQAASPRAIALSRASLPPSSTPDGATPAPTPALWPWVLGAILIVIVLAALAIRH